MYRMPFEPKIVRSGEVPFDASGDAWTGDEFEARLPEDLGALAVQLREDASHLAALYPAKHGQENVVAPRVSRPANRAAWLWVSAGTLAAVSLSLILALPLILPDDVSTEPNTLTVDDYRRADDARRTEAHRVAGAAPDNLDSREAPRSSAGAMPAIFLQNVSGPELEGLFDLWEADEVQQSRISI
jgi:hypothetical protein